MSIINVLRLTFACLWLVQKGNNSWEVVQKSQRSSKRCFEGSHASCIHLGTSTLALCPLLLLRGRYWSKLVQGGASSVTGTKSEWRLLNAPRRKAFSVGNVEQLIKMTHLKLMMTQKMPVTKFFILRLQWERQSREVGIFTRHEEIARIVISQEAIRKDLAELRRLQGWQRVRRGYIVSLPNCSMIQDLGEGDTEHQAKGRAILAERLLRRAPWNCDKKTWNEHHKKRGVSLSKVVQI